MEKPPTVCCVIVVNKKQEILLIKRAREPYKNHWALISGIGYSKKGLSPKEGVTDEVKGDIGTPPFSIQELFATKDNDQDIVVFQAAVDEQKIMPQLPYAQEYRWIPLSKLAELDELAFNHKDILNKYSDSLGK